MESERRLYRVNPAAESLDVSPQTIRRLVKANELRAVRLPGGDLRIPASELDAYVTRKIAEAEAAAGTQQSAAQTVRASA